MANVNESSGASVTKPSSNTILKRKSNDIGWEFGILINPNNLDKVKCKLCGKVMSGGAYRMKEHIAHISGNVSSCPRATPKDQARCRQAIMDTKNKKKNRKNEEDSMRTKVNVLGNEEEIQESLGPMDIQEYRGPMDIQEYRGPMDRFALVISPKSSTGGSKTMRQHNINEASFEEKTHHVHRYVARWMYEAGIPFNAIDNDNFKLLVEAIGQFGPGYKPPNQYQLREPLLKEEVERTKELLKKQEQEWALDGCSIIMDAWTDEKRRSIMNLFVNSKEGTMFFSFKEFFDKAPTAQHIFEYVDKCINQVGPQNVVQVVTDSVTNNMVAAKLLKEKRPNIFWTSCATHTINLMLESIGKLPRFKKIIDQAKTFTIFIYAHHKTLSMMRSFTKKRDIVKSGVTRFASSFLTLQTLVEKKSSLKAMFTCDSWKKCKWAKTEKGKLAYSTVMSIDFWNGVTSCLKVFSPLVKVLRIVVGDRKPSMGFLYGELKQAKQDIREVLSNVESNYRPIFDIIDARMRDRLDTPLHTMAYLLNPYYFYKDPSIAKDKDMMFGVFRCVEVFFGDDIEMQSEVINVELTMYKQKEGAFGTIWATKGCEKNGEKFCPVSWWSTYGVETPNLQRMATRILSLTTSSSRCERIWSTFKGMHMKKRNKLDVNWLNNLAFVQFNAKLMNKHKMENERNVDVLLASEASNAQRWIVDCGDDDVVESDDGLTSQMVDEVTEADGILQPQKSSRMRELHEDNFASEDEDEEEEHNHIEFLSDIAHLLEEDELYHSES